MKISFDAKIYSQMLVTFQFLIILILLVINPSIFENKLSLIISVSGFVIGMYSLVSNKISNFNIIPEIKTNAKLIQTGAYKYIRHPMYFSVLLMMIGIVIGNINLINFILFVLLVFILYLKAKKEEKLWLEKTPEYKEYMKNTKTFIPFIL